MEMPDDKKGYLKIYCVLIEVNGKVFCGGYYVVLVGFSGKIAYRYFHCTLSALKIVIWPKRPLNYGMYEL